MLKTPGAHHLAHGTAGAWDTLNINSLIKGLFIVVCSELRKLTRIVTPCLRSKEREEI